MLKIMNYENLKFLDNLILLMLTFAFFVIK